MYIKIKNAEPFYYYYYYCLNKRSEQVKDLEIWWYFDITDISISVALMQFSSKDCYVPLDPHTWKNINK